MCRGMIQVLDKPLTVKLRMGIKSEALVAHKLIPKLKDLGVAAFTVHGRTKKQHYYHTADWNYIEQCASVAHDSPLFGNGDVFSYADYEQHMANSKMAGVMIARFSLPLKNSLVT